MFSLIVAIVSIALVVALVALSAYHGGPALSDAKAKAEAARLRTEEQQIFAAVDFFQADQRRFPTDVQELVAGGYLRSVPRGLHAAIETQPSLVSMAYAQSAPVGWSTPLAGQPIYTTGSKVPLEVCRKYNKAVRGDDGILKLAYTSVGSQCYGQNGAYQVVIAKQSAIAQMDVAVGTDKVIDAPLPSPVSGGEWEVLPNESAPSPTVPEEPEAPTSRATLISDASITFNETWEAGEVSSSVSYRNDGNTPLTLSVPPLSSPLRVASNSCAEVPAGATCQVVIALAKNAQQVASGSQTMSAAGASVNPSPVTVNFALATTVARWAPAVLAIPRTYIGSSNTQSALLYNDGSAVANFSASLVGLPAGFTANTAACASVPAGGSCQVQFTFTPLAAGTVASSVNPTAASWTANALQLSGVGEQGTPYVEASADFSSVEIDAGYAYTVEFANYGTGPATFTNLSSTVGAAASVQTTCSSTLNAGDFCTVTMQTHQSMGGGLAGTISAKFGSQSFRLDVRTR